MVGNPPAQTLPPELTADVLDQKQSPTADLKSLLSLKVGCLKSCLEAPVTHSYGNTALLSPTIGTTAFQEKADPTKNVDGNEKNGLVVPLIQDLANHTKKTYTQAQTVLSLSPAVQSSSHFKVGQPIAFLLPSNTGSPVGKTALPSLGQVSALSTDCHAQDSTSVMSTQFRPYPYHLSIGRALAPETKLSTAALQSTCGTVSSDKSFKTRKEHTLTKDSVPSPAGPFPLKQCTLDSVPVLPLTFSLSSHTCSAQASINVQSRVLSEMEKTPSTNVPCSVENASLTYARLKSLCSTEEHPVVCPSEARDMPLDLSSKSKREKTVPEAQKTLLLDPHMESGQNDAMASKKNHQTQANIGPAVPYAILLDTTRNGASPKNCVTLLNHQVLEPSTSYAKISLNGSINLPGTYVGVANPVLASTLCSKHGKNATFVDDLQSLPKPETISIIDQGDQLVLKGKKGQPVTRDAQKCHSKHLSVIHKNGNVPQPKDAIVSAHIRHSQCKIGGKKAVVQHSPKVNRMAPLSSLTASVQRKASERSPQLWTSANCQDTLLQSSPKMVEEKQETSKWYLSSPISPVKQAVPKMSSLTGQGCCNPASLDPEKLSTESLPAGPVESPTRPTREDIAFSSQRKKDVKLKRNSSCGTLSSVPRNNLERDGKAVDKYINQEEVTEGGQQEPRNSTAVHSQVPGDCDQSKAKDKRKTQSDFESRDLKMDEKPITARISPCAKLGTIAFSILTGKSIDVDEIMEGTYSSSGVKEGSTMAPATVKKARQNKQGKMPEDPLGTSTTKYQEDIPVIKKKQEAKKPNTQLVPPMEPRQPAVKDQRRPLKGKGRIFVEEPSDSKAGDRSSCPPAPLTTRDASGRLTGSTAEVCSSEGGAPKAKRGRRRAEEMEQGSHDSSVASLPALPLPPRRPRGRPRSTPRPNNAQHTPMVARRSPEFHSGLERKRKRCKNRRYQSGEYIMERHVRTEETMRKCMTTRRAAREEAVQKMGGMYPRLRSAPPGRCASPDSCPGGVLLTHCGSVRHQDSPTPELTDKPSGKRKFKSKHLSDKEEEEEKPNIKHGSLGKRVASPTTDVSGIPLKRPSSPSLGSTPTAGKRGITRKRGTAESELGRPVPPEVRRLIVNKNAGETLLQRAARLGYQEVVLYCLERDVREVNRRDNAGYTALHEASAQGWAAIVGLLLDHGADVNCSAQDGTRPIHDAVASDNLTVVWMLLSHGADPTLATYSGQTVLKLAQSNSMKTFLTEYCTDLEGRPDEDPGLQWEFYSSLLFEKEEKECWDFLLSMPKESEQDREEEMDAEDTFLFEFSEEPHIPCYHIQVSLSQGYCNWFLLSDVLRRLKTSARIFQARYPHFEVVGIACGELRQQVSVSQMALLPEELFWEGDGDRDSPVQLVRCVPALQRLLGSSVHRLPQEKLSDTVMPSSSLSPAGLIASPTE